MNLGEITGQIYGMSKLEKGMPFRSQYTTKRNERGHFSTLEEDVNIQTDKGTADESKTSFRYFDPAMTSVGKSEFQQISDTPHESYNEIAERQLQNITSGNSEYVNTIAFNMYNEIGKMTMFDFCIFPIGIMQNLIERDMTIAKIMTQVNNSEIYHENRQSINTMASRTSALISLDPQRVKGKINYYEDVNNIAIEFPMSTAGFSFGIICDKNQGEISLNSKLFSSFVSNLKKTNVNVYLPAFRQTNKLNVNIALKNLGYISTDMVKYTQSLYVEFQKTLLIKSASARPIVNLSNNFIYYIRYVPNNVVLFIGRVK